LDLPSYPKADAQSYFQLARALDGSDVDAVSQDAHCHNDLSLIDAFKWKIIILGVVDMARTRVEPVKEIRVRQSALQHIDRHRLMAASDCGLIMLPRDAAIAKLRKLAQAAHSL
jgi:5-methyltetrahydropteroyltriglutamate--homocysteine methyltransferase